MTLGPNQPSLESLVEQVRLNCVSWENGKSLTELATRLAGNIPEASLARVLRECDRIANEKLMHAGCETSCIATLVQLCLAGSKMCSDGLTFWHSLSVQELTESFVRHREANPNNFIRQLNLVEVLAARLDGYDRRRTFLALLKAYKDEFWTWHRYIGTLSSDRWRFRLVERLITRYPEHFADAAALILSAEAPSSAPASLKTKFAGLISSTTNPLTGWGSINMSNLLVEFGELATALVTLHGACLAANDKAVRFEALRLSAKLMAERPLGGVAQLRCLITALRVYPDHVRAADILREVSRLMESIPNIRTTDDALKFDAGEFDILSVDGLIDVSPQAQAWLQIPEFMHPDELATEHRRPPCMPPVFETVIVSASVTTAALPDGSTLYDGDSPWKIATTLRPTTSARRPMHRFRLRDVYLENCGIAVFYMRAGGSTIGALSSGHSSFFSWQHVQDAKPISLMGEFFDLTLPYGHSNYSHFLLDRLPRLIFDESKNATLLVDEESVA